MSRCVWLIGLASLSASAACGPTVNVEQERTALMTVDREWSQATNDADKFASYFAEGASIYSPGVPVVTGGDAIRKMVTEMTKAPGFALSWRATKADVSASGDMGTTAGAYEMTMGGTSEKGKYVTVWKKQTDGTWKVAEDIFNADAVPQAPPGTHAMIAPNTLKWGDAPPGFPPGARIAVVSGDPSQAQPYVLRAQFPPNYRLAPHSHPTTENATVLSGTVALGMGEKWDESAMQDMGPGGFATLPAGMRHFFISKTASTLQLHGIGPFGINYVNAADDPRTK